MKLQVSTSSNGSPIYTVWNTYLDSGIAWRVAGTTYVYKYKNDGTIDVIYLAGYNAGSSSVKNYGCPIGATRINYKTGNVVYN